MKKRCDFCGAAKEDVFKLIVTDTGSAICNNCVDLCVGSIEQEKQKNKTQYDDINPIDLKAHLDEYVIGQDKAKEVLSVAISNHFKRINSHEYIEKSNIIITGPTGCGKTYLIEIIADYLNIPLVISDVTAMTENGYVGDDVSSVLTSLYQKANHDITLAERGIVFLDEVDKLANRSTEQSKQDVSSTGVQQSLLKIVEGSTYHVPTKFKDNSNTVKMNSDNILFIASGAFVGLDKIKQRSTGNSQIGFLTPSKKASIDTNFNHLIKFGMIPEFVGRFPIITEINGLNQSDLFDILTKVKYNLFGQYQHLFRYNDVELEMTEELLNEIAKLALATKTGARGLRTIMEKTLLPYMFELFEYQQKKIKKLKLSTECLNNGNTKNEVK